MSLMGEIETANELAQDIAGNKAEVLRALLFFDNRGNASEIRRAGEIPGGSVNYHLRDLSEKGLIEHVGWEHIGQGGRTKVWELTAEGERVASHLREDQPRIDELPEVMSSVEEHDERLEELQERHRDNFEEVESEIDGLRTEFSELKSSVDELVSALED